MRQRTEDALNEANQRLHMVSGRKCYSLTHSLTISLSHSRRLKLFLFPGKNPGKKNRENDRCTGNPFLFRDRAIDGNSNLVASEVVLDAVVIDEVVIDEVMLDEVVLDKVAPGIGWEAHSRTRRSRTKMRPIHSPVLNNSI